MGGQSSGWLDEFVFSEMWEDLRLGDQQAARTLNDELTRELAPGHPLLGASWVIVARSLARDDVLIQLSADVGALVHLTYTTTPPDTPPWPNTQTVNTADELQLEMLTRD
jgi:hypothetical protein